MTSWIVSIFPCFGQLIGIPTFLRVILLRVPAGHSVLFSPVDEASLVYLDNSRNDVFMSTDFTTLFYTVFFFFFIYVCVYQLTFVTLFLDFTVYVAYRSYHTSKLTDMYNLLSYPLCQCKYQCMYQL